MVSYNHYIWKRPKLLPKFMEYISIKRNKFFFSRADQFYASYPAGTKLLIDTAKVCEIIVWFEICTLLFRMCVSYGCFKLILHWSLIWYDFIYLLVVIFEFVICWYLYKAALAIALKQKSGVLLSIASWQNTLSIKGFFKAE